MKVFEVTWEEDGRTIKEPGVVETAIKSVSAYYVASSMEVVWDRVLHIRDDPERAFKGIREVLQAVSILELGASSSDNTHG